MEIHRRHKSSSSGDMFTFPAISHNLDLEFKLADELFSNGKFLLHTFPEQPPSCTLPRSTILSRTSSVSSKDSLMSSRSNSTSSRSSSSSCSSARTSTSDASPEKRLYGGLASRSGGCAFPKKECQSPVKSQSQSQSQRQCYSWQFIAPVPVLNRRSSRKKRAGKKEGGRREGFCRRFLGWLVWTCKVCHAMDMEPSNSDSVLKGTLGFQ